MKKILLILLSCVLTIQASAQRQANSTTVNRKAGLFKNAYKNDFSGSFTYGIIGFGGDLSTATEEQSFTKNFTLNKRINAGITLSTKVSTGQIHGQGDVYNSEHEYTSNNTFSNKFLAYGFLVKKQLNNTKESNSRVFKINIATGLGVISSEVNLHPDHFSVPDSKLNFKTAYIPIVLDFEYFFTPHIGFILSSELSYFFSDKIDLHGVNFGPKTLTKMDLFTGYTAGICIKLE